MNELKSKKAMRDSGIELLRIIMMLQVIFLHICDHGGYREQAFSLSGKHELLYMITWLSSRCPVYVFILIFGYFSVTSNKTVEQMWKRLPKIYLPMLFYSLLLAFGGQLLNLWELENTEAKVQAFLPVTSRLWYFMSVYIILLILSPFINRCLISLNVKEYAFLLGFLFLLFSVWSPLTELEDLKEVISTKYVINIEGGKSLYGFAFMYILGGFLRLHTTPHEKCRFRYLAVFILMTAVNYALYRAFPDYYGIVDYNSNPFAVIQCICLLLFFRDMKFKSAAINHIAGLTFGIYMIHDNKYVRDHIWQEVFSVNEKSFYSTHLYPFKIIAICICIFIFCGCIEQIRQWLFAGITKLWILAGNKDESRS